MKQPQKTSFKSGRLLEHVSLCGILAAGVIGCNEAAPPTAAQRQDQVLSNPMGYKPAFHQDISGGDITTFDKPGFNRDVNDALSP